MSEDAKQMLHIQLDLLKKTMKEYGVLMAIQVDKTDYNESKLAFISWSDYISGKGYVGITVALNDMNNGIV